MLHCYRDNILYYTLAEVNHNLVCLRWRVRHYVVTNTDICTRFASVKTIVIVLIAFKF